MGLHLISNWDYGFISLLWNWDYWITPGLKFGLWEFWTPTHPHVKGPYIYLYGLPLLKEALLILLTPRLINCSNTSWHSVMLFLKTSYSSKGCWAAKNLNRVVERHTFLVMICDIQHWVVWCVINSTLLITYWSSVHQLNIILVLTLLTLTLGYCSIQT